MTLGDKLAILRKENNYTQEQLAGILGVSRQAISKWESNITYPETDKLIRMSELFNCSLDYLLKETVETDNRDPDNREYNHEETSFFKKHLQERKSEKTVWGMPLWHIGRRAQGFFAVGLNARGVIAIGLKAQGIISLGMISMGVFSLGLFSLGLIAIGLFALGVLSAGCFSIGIFTAGAISLGIISVGAISVGEFSIGALACGKYFALGDNARAMVALGDSQAVGSVFQKIGELSAQDIAVVKQSLDEVVPNYFSWAKEIVKLLLW
ncbi:MAG: helix-turn-helix domain-containing protein [Lachnospiraceae bacterium]|nr:helix-turn-helix domain-containing protein [Lachnospiraceae bacterium]